MKRLKHQPLLLGVVLMLGLSAAVAVAAEKPPLNDQAISDAIEDEIGFDQAVRLNNIDVRTTEGIVTLTGEVDNALAQDRAARLAETVKGVRAVVNRIQIAPAQTREDAEIHTDIVEALAYSPATDSYEIEIDVADHVVTLSGKVQSWQEKRFAEKVAQSVRGVTAVKNNIDVDYVDERPDTEIEPEIRRALRWDALVDHALIDVDVEDGKVTLSGTVGSAAEKRRARQNAGVPGVTFVDATDLDVQRWARDEDLRKNKYVEKTPAEVGRAVTDALLYDPRVVGRNVTVDMLGSVATLRGEVDSLAAKRAAGQDARHTLGVSSVVNRLRVRSEEDLSDEAIARNIRNALTRDPYVERFEIDVDVVDKTVRLSGMVDTYFEKRRADEIAAAARGAEEVRNNLDVADAATVMTYEPYIDGVLIYEYDWYDYEPTATFARDAEIFNDIQDELWWSPFVDSDEVNLSVSNGVATLTGTVETDAERQAAVDNAYEGGATWVIDKIDVEFD
jgi:osmotically-inducible protein OsmY